MQNIEMKTEGNTLTIKIDLSKNFGLSGSGKTTIIASSKGNVDIGGGVKMGLNIYKGK